jgi:hypothetical protein
LPNSYSTSEFGYRKTVASVATVSAAPGFGKFAEPYRRLVFVPSMLTEHIEPVDIREQIATFTLSLQPARGMMILSHFGVLISVRHAAVRRSFRGNNSMKKCWILGLLVLLAVTSSDASAWLYVFAEKDLKSMAQGSLIGGIRDESVNELPLPTPSYGYMVNSASYYLFNGDTATLNRWLEKEARGLEIVREETTVAKVVIHTGVGEYKRPADPDQIVRRADWSLAIRPSVKLSDDRKKTSTTLRVTVHVWPGEQVRFDAIKIPKGFVIESGGEIERFIRTQSPAVITSEGQQSHWWEE